MLLRKQLWWTFLALMVQILILNRINLLGYATPFFFIYIILILDTKKNPAVRMLWGFFMGLVVDVFSNTPGMHAASLTLLAFIQPALLGLFAHYDKRILFEPAVENINTRQYVFYLILGTLIHHTAYFLLRNFSLYDFSHLLLEILLSTLLSVLLMVAFEYAFRVKRRRR